MSNQVQTEENSPFLIDWLEKGHSSSRNKEDDRIDGGRRDTVPTDRVSVIGDIDVPDSAVEALPKGPGFAPRRKAPPKGSRAVEESIKHFPQDVERLVNKGVSKIKRNLTRKQLTSIKALRDDSSITITQSDKAGKMVKMKTDELQDLNLVHF